MPIDTSLFYFEAETANVNIAVTVDSLLVSSTDGQNWSPLTTSGVTLANVGDKLYVKAAQAQTSVHDDQDRHQFFKITGGQAGAYGSVMWLLDPTGANQTEIPTRASGDYDGNFYYLFGDCAGLTHAPSLPATVLKPECYRGMFGGCTGLTGRVDLPATTLANGCYMEMFTSYGEPDKQVPVTEIHLGYDGEVTTAYVGEKTQYEDTTWLFAAPGPGVVYTPASTTFASGAALPTGWTQQAEAPAPAPIPAPSRAHLKKHHLASALDHDLTGLDGVLQTETDTNGTTSLSAVPFDEMLQSQTVLYSKAEVDALIAAGIWKNNTALVIANHAAAAAADVSVGKKVVDTTDKKVYEVTAVSGSTVTFDAGYKPTTPEIRVDEKTDHTWVYDVEGDSWLDQGSSSHSRTHAMTSTADHSAGQNKVFYSDANGEVKELALGPAGTVLQSGGAGQAPVFVPLSIGSLDSDIGQAAGEVPADADMTADAVGTMRIFAGTGGLFFFAIKTSSGVKSVEIG